MIQLPKNIIFHARLREDEPAVATTSAVASYRTLAKAVWAAVDKLEPLGLSQSRMVVIDVGHTLHHLYLMLGLALLGVPTCSLSGSGGPLPGSGPKPVLILTDSERAGDGVQTLRVNGDWFSSDPKLPPDYARLLSLPDLSADHTMRYVFSSGTTGRRKCVGYTLGRMAQTAMGNPLTQSGKNAISGGSLSVADFSTGPGTNAPYRTLGRGGFLCLAQGPAAAIELIRLFRLETMNGSVGQIQGILELLRGRRPLSSLREVRVSGAKLPLRLLAEIRAKICTEVVFSYASTEMGLIAVGSGGVIERQEGTVGYVLPGVKVEIVDDTGGRLPFGTDGRLRVKPVRESFYVNDDGGRVDILNDGWFYPGDIARMTADGLLTIVGRAGDVINRAGVVIAPEVVEEVFVRDARVKDAAAFGAPGRNGLEEIWLAVVVDGDVDINQLHQQGASALREMAPDRIFRVDNIPRSENKKVQRYRLREQIQAALAKAQPQIS